MPDVLEILKKLPEIAFIDNRSGVAGKAPIIAVRRGVMGYWPVFTTLTAVELNEGDCTPAQAAAMHAGSMFGWDAPLADPDRYRADGSLLESTPRSAD